MLRILFLLIMLVCSAAANGTLAGGRPNAVSGGQNAFAGIINPANAVWVHDRVDVGAFWLCQKSSLDNRDNNPNFLPGKISTSYKANNLVTFDAAINKHIQPTIGCKEYEASLSLAAYTTPSYSKVRTKDAIPIVGTTPIEVKSRVDVISAIFSLKIASNHSIGISLEYYTFSLLRKGFQRSDTPQRSVSPGNVTNNGKDHSEGMGISLGWRWKITKSLDFGAAWVRKNPCGQFRRYRGYEAHHGKNFTPQTVGVGVTYVFTSRFAGRLEVLWSNLGNLPNANNNVLPNGALNTNKRGSDKSPGPGLQDATYINVGLGYKWSDSFSFGVGLSHRIKLPRKRANILSHTYTFQTIYNVISFGADFRTKKHEIFLGFLYGIRNKVSGIMPKVVGGGRFTAKKVNAGISCSWGYLY